MPRFHQLWGQFPLWTLRVAHLGQNSDAFVTDGKGLRIFDTVQHAQAFTVAMRQNKPFEASVCARKSKILGPNAFSTGLQKIVSVFSIEDAT